MRVQILASGSKGNSTLIETDKAKILIDLGINFAQVKKRLTCINLIPEEIDAIVITHTHSDHIKGLASFVKKTSVPVYTVEQNVLELNKYVEMSNINIINGSFNIGDLNINIFNLSHDVPVIGLLIKNAVTELVYMTDTGYINKRYFELLKGKDIYIVESNYDEEMLLNGPYPQILKQRVIGDSGHLSNSYIGKFLTKVINNNTKYIFLAHISENNNTPALAYETVSDLIVDTGFDLENLFVANQHELTKAVEVKSEDI